MTFVAMGCLAWAWAVGTVAAADKPTYWQSTEAEDYTIDRKEVFEFTKKPTFARDGDRVTINFASKDYCDATIVIEKNDGTILRHLASGVLGSNAPEPFQTNSLVQTVVWDGKNDRGEYVDDLSDVHVRVSLGLRAQFERTLYWHPKKRCALRQNPYAVAQPEGVYVYDGGGVEQIKLFGHDGKYIRTVYPFPADKVSQVKGLGWRSFPDGHRNPKHIGHWQSTFLPSGTGYTVATWGSAAQAFAVHNGRIAVVPGDSHRCQFEESGYALGRLCTDGSTGDLDLYGPLVKTPYAMHSAALSPDGKWLYLTGSYSYHKSWGHAEYSGFWHHGVYRMAYGGHEPPALWLGKDNKAGNGDLEFNQPSSVCVDAQGRVYVADNFNDRVQIFSPEGKLLKSLPVEGPAILQIHHKTQELYCFCWAMALGRDIPIHKAAAVLAVFDPFKSTEATQRIPIPLLGYGGSGLWSHNPADGMPFRVMLDSYTDPATVWMMTMCPGRSGYYANKRMLSFERYRIEGGKFVRLESFDDEAHAETVSITPPDVERQRLLVNPLSGMLYVMEEGRCVSGELIRLDPDTGKAALVRLPYHANQIAFDTLGNMLLRCDRLIGRFTVNDLREVPFDYGEEHGVSWDSFSRKGHLMSAIMLPGARPGCWMDPDMGVNPRGEILVTAVNMLGKDDVTYLKRETVETVSRKYVPTVFRGRRCYAELHMFDKHGKVVEMDIAAKGAPEATTVLVGTRGDVYFHAMRHRIYNGKHFETLTGCLIKFRRGKGRFLTTHKAAPVPLGDQKPDVPAQLASTSDICWVEDAEWIFPGVGYARCRGLCNCWWSSFALDFLDRSFVPQYIRGQVAVLDTNGNLIMQIGRYGNVDDGKPLVADQRLRSEPPRSIGGDEVALMYPNFTAVHSDHRLFISDTGNSRILSVKLDYHANERVALKAATDAAQQQ